MATPAHAATEAPHATGTFPPFASETFASQLFWLAITFGALYWLMSKVIVPQISTILEDRRRKVETDLANAEAARTEAEAAGAAYEKALADARGNAQAIAADTHAKVAADAETQRKALDAELSAKLAAAEAQIAATKAAAMGNVHGIAVDAAGAIVEKLGGGKVKAAEVKSAVDAALKR